MLHYNKTIIFKNFWITNLIPFCYKKLIYNNYNTFIRLNKLSLELHLYNVIDIKNTFNSIFKLWLTFYLFFGQKGKILNIKEYYKTTISNKIKLTKLNIKINYKKIFLWNFFSNLFILKNIKNINNFFINKLYNAKTNYLKLQFNLIDFLNYNFLEINDTKCYIFINYSKNNKCMIKKNELLLKKTLLYLF